MDREYYILSYTCIYINNTPSHRGGKRHSWRRLCVRVFVAFLFAFVWASDAACWSWRRWLLERITCGDAGNKRKQMIYSILVDLSWYPFIIGMENAINPRWIRG